MDLVAYLLLALRCWKCNSLIWGCDVVTLIVFQVSFTTISMSRLPQKNTRGNIQHVIDLSERPWLPKRLGYRVQTFGPGIAKDDNCNTVATCCSPLMISGLVVRGKAWTHAWYRRSLLVS